MTTAGLRPVVGMGCMRLSTAPDRDDDRAIRVLHAAFEAGVTFLDTADAYCHDDGDTGHNERLIARALATWDGDRAAIRVATKGGLTRPAGRWVPDGRARSLIAACAASRRALAVDRIHLYQLHAPDPGVPLATSVRALHSLKRDGLIESIGLCNVTVGQLEEARAITEIASVQIELSLWHDAGVLGGMLEHCLQHAIRLIAFRPLGGPERRRRIESDALLGELGARHGATPFEIALAAVAATAPIVVPVPGATRCDTARSIARAHRIVLDRDDLARLGECYPTLRALQVHDAQAVGPQTVSDGEIVMVMGLPGAGKSTVAQSLVSEGYARVNRDEAGGSLRGLLPAVDRLIESGQRRLVLDNTYVSRKARGAVVQAARQRRLQVRCVWMSTGIDDAQVNAAARIVSRYGRLLGPEELRAASRHDPAAFGPAVQFRFQREFEPPDIGEGFSRVEVLPFERRRDHSSSNRAVLLSCEGVLLQSRSGRRMAVSPADADVFVHRGATLRRYAADSWRLLAIAWLPEITGQSMSTADAEAVFAQLRALLGVNLDVEYCPHPAGPPICWCRKPLPGLGVVFIQRYQLDPSRCLYVGSGPQDPGFARKLGFQYRDADEFFTASG